MNSTAKYKNFGVLAAMALFMATGIAMRAQSANAMRLVHMQQQISLEIGPYLTGLSLPLPTVAAVEAFLLRREVAVADAIDQGLQRGLSPAQAGPLTAAARAKVDAGIDSSFDPSTAVIVKDIVRNYVGYSLIARIYGRHMAASGAPLTASQTRDLANTLYNCNSALVNASATQMRKSVDPASGLSTLDQMILTEASGYLSASQKAVLQEDLAKISHAVISGNPLTY
jgi:hypothetical protein